MLARKVLDTISKYKLIEKGDNVVVGFSGGPDSVCLLHVLHTLSKQIGINLYAVHINHMLRSNESDEDEAFARKFCDELGVHLHVKAFDIRKMARDMKISEEEAGREARYSEFYDFAQKVGGAKIAVAHNKNDQAETVIMRIIRGTGIDGLKGMSHKRDNIIRPLLDIERKEIEKYCLDNGLTPAIDSSNLKSVYMRNKIRLKLIPYINREFDTDIIESLYRMSMVIQDDIEIIETSVKAAYNNCASSSGDGWLNILISSFNALDHGMAKRVVRSAVNQIKGNLAGIENAHIESVVDLVKDGRTGAKVQLPHRIRAVRSYEIVKIFIESESEQLQEFDIEANIPGITNIKEISASIEAELYEMVGKPGNYSRTESSLEQFFDYGKLIGGINIRSRKDGDVFKPLKSSGTKKLKKYFIDKKIPRDMRDRMPLIAKNKEIVWIIGYKTSDNFKVTENTKKVLRLKYISEGS